MKAATIALVIATALSAAACKPGSADSFNKRFPNQITGAGE